jgi:hypothetical protein
MSCLCWVRERTRPLSEEYTGPNSTYYYWGTKRRILDASATAAYAGGVLLSLLFVACYITGLLDSDRVYDGYWWNVEMIGYAAILCWVLYGPLYLMFTRKK